MTSDDYECTKWDLRGKVVSWGGSFGSLAFQIILVALKRLLYFQLTFYRTRAFCVTLQAVGLWESSDGEGKRTETTF
jgi:hypothetical protein